MAPGTVVDVVMPQMGVSVTEGTVTRWLRTVGDRVRADDTLLEISTDKVDTEVPCAASGVVSEILVAEGETVVVGTVLARIDTGTRDAPPPTAPTPPAPPADERESAATPSALGDGRDAANGGGSAERVFVSPVVARIAAEHDIDLATVSGSGSGGRITKQDVLSRLERSPETREPSPPSFEDEDASQRLTPAVRERRAEEAPSPPDRPPADAPTARESEPQLQPGERLEQLSAMRRGIAEHMRRSLDTAAHVTSVLEVDMTDVVAMREQIKADYEGSYGVRPTYLAFIARAAVETLRDWPWLNAELRPDGILTRTFVNLGVAVSLDGAKGLIVPVIKHAEGLNLVGMARAIADLAERARARQLLPDDVQGGTFTVTSLGSYGTLLGTPVISQPQSAILGAYTITKRPWVITDTGGQDSIAIRSIMNLTLTYDHRLIDGAYAAQFLRELGSRLERWQLSDY